MIKDYFALVVRTLHKRGIRTWLTMLGIFIGIAAVVALISIGQGLEYSINKELEKLGSDKLMIQPKGSTAPGAQTSTITLTDGDLKRVRSTKGVEEATSYLIEPVKIEFNDETRFVNVIGVPSDEGKKLFYEVTHGLTIKEGRDVSEGEKNKVALGIAWKEDDLFSKNIELRNTIKINDVEFKVVGFYDRLGNPEDDKLILMDLDFMEDFFNIDDRHDIIVVRASPGANVDIVADNIEKELRNYRNLDEGKEDFEVQTFQEVIAVLNTVLLVVQIVLIGVGAISLIVGGIGITNTMYTAVLERTKEIGIMKSIGARNSDIFLLFFIESGLLGAIGGLIGIIIGISVSKLVEFAAASAGITFFQVFFPWYLMIGALLFSFIVGAISGTLPAIQASKLKPVDALRYE